MRSLRLHALDIELEETKQVWLGFSPQPYREPNTVAMCMLVADVNDVKNAVQIPYADLIARPTLLQSILARMDHVIQKSDTRGPFTARYLPCGATWNVITDGFLYAANYVRFHTTTVRLDCDTLPKRFSVECRRAKQMDPYLLLARLARLVDFERGILKALKRHRDFIVASVEAEGVVASPSVLRMILNHFETGLRTGAMLKHLVSDEATLMPGIAPEIAPLKAILAKHEPCDAAIKLKGRKRSRDTDSKQSEDAARPFVSDPFSMLAELPIKGCLILAEDGTDELVLNPLRRMAERYASALHTGLF